MNGIPDDTILIEQALEGDERAYAALVKRHQGMVARVIMRVTNRPDQVEDIAQEVFISAFQNLDRFKRRSGLGTWLYRIAVNKSIEALRREKAQRSLYERAMNEPSFFPDSVIFSERHSGEKLVLERERQAMLFDALERLPMESRTILTLRYIEELSTTEISRVLEIPEGTVRSRLYYSRIELARILGPFMDALPARAEKGE